MNDPIAGAVMGPLTTEAPQPAELDPTTQTDLTTHLNRLVFLIQEIQEQVDRQGAPYTPIVIEQHRGPFYRVMVALGDWINQFLASQPPPADILLVRHKVVTPIRDWSHTSPLLRHSLGKPRGKSSAPELVQRLLDNRPAGADIPSLVLNDFYKHSTGGIAYLGRLELLIEALAHETLRRAAAGSKPMRILSLHISGANELRTLLENETFAAVAQITCLDERAHVLREMAQNLPAHWKKNFLFVRADPLRYASSPHHPTRPFDLIYSVSLFEHLDLPQASQLARDCHDLLAPGGALLVGSVTPDVPPGEQVLRAWLTDWDLQYRDETTWRRVFATSGFAGAHLLFTYEPLGANVLIRAERSLQISAGKTP